MAQGETAAKWESMEQAGAFEINVSGDRSPVDEAREGVATAPSKLPQLSDKERDVAKKLGVPVESYQRMKLAGAAGRQRLESRAKALGEQAQKLLGDLGHTYKLVAVEWQGARQRWLLRIEIPDRVVGVPVAAELADDVLDSGILQEIAKLKSAIAVGIGQDEQTMQRG